VPWLWLLTSLLLLTSPAGSNALGPGVHRDPGSPAGKEYAFPLGQARGIGGGTGSFGRGIARTPVGARPAPKPKADNRTATSNATRRSADRAGAKTRKGALPPGHGNPTGARALAVDRSPRPAATASASGVAWMLGAAICVVALGALGSQALVRPAHRENARAD
jgi:hypothetical protein